MSLAHLHLLLNHVPVLGSIFGLALLVAAMARKSEDLARASLVGFVTVALLTIPAYVTGNAAKEEVCKTPQNAPPTTCPDPYSGVTEASAEAHESAAFPAMTLMEITGALAWLGLWQFRRFARLQRWTEVLITVCALATSGLMARVALLGGEVRHVEIRDVVAQVAGPPGFARALGLWIVNTRWVWPTLETVHFLGLSLLFGVAALVDLRVLGLMKGLPFRTVHRVLPWGILGFGLNLVTGMLFFVGSPQQYDQSLLFYLKLILIIAAGLNVLYFTLFERVWAMGAGDNPPLTGKAVAALSLILVVAILYCGRMLPFLGTSF